MTTFSSTADVKPSTQPRLTTRSTTRCHLGREVCPHAIVITATAILCRSRHVTAPLSSALHLREEAKASQQSSRSETIFFLPPSPISLTSMIMPPFPHRAPTTWRPYCSPKSGDTAAVAPAWNSFTPNVCMAGFLPLPSGGFLSPLFQHGEQGCGLCSLPCLSTRGVGDAVLPRPLSVSGTHVSWSGCCWPGSLSRHCF